MTQTLLHHAAELGPSLAGIDTSISGAFVTDAPAAPQLTRVPKELVHLRHDDAVLCTGWQRHDAHHYTVTAHWPPGATRHVPGHGTHHDPVITARTIRQAALLIAHAEFDAPLQHPTLLHTFDYTLDPTQPAPPVTHATDITLHLTATPTATRRNQTTALHIRMTLARNDVPIGTAETTFEWVPPMVYRRLRGDYYAPVTQQQPLPAPVPPHRLGLTSRAQVLISPTSQPHRYLLRNDIANPTHYDHPLDHVPGLALLDAAHQAAHLAAPSAVPFRPTGTRTTFDRFIEINEPTQLAAYVTSTLEATTITVTGHQNDHLAFTTHLTQHPGALAEFDMATYADSNADAADHSGTY
ncbi:ScbA/BarX family gamma-butyrolactone biosynthesis protein [Streptomyces sp. ISL-11]|uniref:ScbA/BarX family gamma-butyrolactone biosynthesis protein n=1 Tax=Streptomyces sp. ISL-11 TaxID=2819174 RepID=UPI001BE8F17C|nr:ScbA/BarX family gamma-butyrolactone biosynthesis protein [Streptomyces sp. ISL-11]MBT2387339.1 hypothetical protein [Streptomyces sp. ISL-11]